MLIKERTSKRGSGAHANDYTDAFNLKGWVFRMCNEYKLLSGWTQEQFIAVRNQIKVLLQRRLNEIIDVYTTLGFEVSKLQPILKVLMGEINELTLGEFRDIQLVSNLSYTRARICGTKKDYEFSGECDITTVQGTSVALGGIEAKNTVKHLLTPTERLLSFDAKKACAQCASQMLAHAEVLSEYFEVCSFMQIVTNGWEWILVIRKLHGGEYIYRHFDPIAICNFNVADKTLTAKDLNNECFDAVSHLIALMQDNCRYLLNMTQTASLTTGIEAIDLDKDHSTDYKDNGGGDDGNLEEDFDEDPDSCGKPKADKKQSGNQLKNDSVNKNRRNSCSSQMNDEKHNASQNIPQNSRTTAPTRYAHLTINNVQKHAKMLSSRQLPYDIGNVSAFY